MSDAYDSAGARHTGTAIAVDLRGYWRAAVSSPTPEAWAEAAQSNIDVPPPGRIEVFWLLGTAGFREFIVADDRGFLTWQSPVVSPEAGGHRVHFLIPDDEGRASCPCL